MTHIFFQPIETSRVSQIRPADKKGLVRASRETSPMMREAIDAGLIENGEVLERELIAFQHFTPAGTHDGIRDAEYSRTQWGWAFSRPAE
jgi:hypothetical protein